MNPLVGTTILIVALVAALLLAIFFIVCRRYEDGIVGNPLLWGIVIACGLLLKDAWARELEIPAAPWCLLLVCMVCFLLRHGYRFAMFHWAGQFAWLRPRDHDSKDAVRMDFRTER